MRRFKEIDEQILNKDDEIKDFGKGKQILESNANRTKGCDRKN